MVVGVVALERDAAMSAAAVDLAAGVIRIGRVLAPDDGWVVVRSSVAPGGILGAARVRRGENRDVVVRLKAVDGTRVRIALHVDRGAPGVLEFDPARPSLALDRPVLVDGKAVESPLVLDGYGAEVFPNSALVAVEDGHVRGGVLTVSYLIVPGRSWIVVDAVEDGVPIRQVGLAPRPAGEWHEVKVPVAGIADVEELAVTLYADRGVIGRFDRSISHPLSSADQPYVSTGVVASTRATVR